MLVNSTAVLTRSKFKCFTHIEKHTTSCILLCVDLPQYLEPEPQAQIKPKATQQEEPTKTGASSPRLHTSQDKVTEQLPGVFYDELTGLGHPKELKPSQHSVTSLPSSMPKYSSLHIEDSSEKEKPKELLPMYSMPNKSKKEAQQKEREQKVRETELSHLQTLNNNRQHAEEQRAGQAGKAAMTTTQKSPSPPPPQLPPKPGQTSKLAEDTKQEVEDEESAYAEVSSRPLASAAQRQRQSIHSSNVTAVGTTTSPIQLQAHNSPTSEREASHFPRSFSVEGFFGNEAAHHQKLSSTDLCALYDEPLNLSGNKRGKIQAQVQQREETHGFFRMS